MDVGPDEEGDQLRDQSVSGEEMAAVFTRQIPAYPFVRDYSTSKDKVSHRLDYRMAVMQKKNVLTGGQMRKQWVKIENLTVLEALSIDLKEAVYEPDQQTVTKFNSSQFLAPFIKNIKYNSTAAADFPKSYEEWRRRGYHNFKII